MAEEGASPPAEQQQQQQQQHKKKKNKGKPRKRKPKISDEVAERIQARLKAATYGVASPLDFFRRFDRDGNGLDAKEFTKMIRTNLKIPKKDLEDREIEALVVALDDDGSGELSVEELADFVERGKDALYSQAPGADDPGAAPGGKWGERVDAKATTEAMAALRAKKRANPLEQAVVSKLQARLQAATYGEEPAAFFRRMDKDGGGTLDGEEFLRVIRKELKIPPGEISDADVKTLVRLLDDDGGGTLSIEELADFVLRGAATFGTGPSDPSELPEGAMAWGGRAEDSERLKALKAEKRRKRRAKSGKDLRTGLDLQAVGRVQARLKAAVYGTDARTFFSRFDKDAGGTLDGDEFLMLLRKELKIPPLELSDTDIGKLVWALDDDGSGTIGLDELADFVKHGVDTFFNDDHGDDDEEASGLAGAWGAGGVGSTESQGATTPAMRKVFPGMDWQRPFAITLRKTERVLDEFRKWKNKLGMARLLMQQAETRRQMALCTMAHREYELGKAAEALGEALDCIEDHFGGRDNTMAATCLERLAEIHIASGKAAFPNAHAAYAEAAASLEAGRSGGGGIGTRAVAKLAHTHACFLGQHMSDNPVMIQTALDLHDKAAAVLTEHLEATRAAEIRLPEGLAGSKMRAYEKEAEIKRQIRVNALARQLAEALTAKGDSLRRSGALSASIPCYEQASQIIVHHVDEEVEKKPGQQGQARGRTAGKAGQQQQQHHKSKKNKETSRGGTRGAGRSRSRDRGTGGNNNGEASDAESVADAPPKQPWTPMTREKNIGEFMRVFAVSEAAGTKILDTRRVVAEEQRNTKAVEAGAPPRWL